MKQINTILAYGRITTITARRCYHNNTQTHNNSTALLQQDIEYVKWDQERDAHRWTAHALARPLTCAPWKIALAGVACARVQFEGCTK